ncbi:MAG: hypothetical protein ACI8P9_002634 [Parasphingorhabdus sp.]|jgi:hypothetical protein
MVSSEVASLYHHQFVGMAIESIEVDQLQALQKALPGQIVSALTTKQREFLLGFKRGSPSWQLLPYENIRNLPGVRWKQQNLDKMDELKRYQAIEKLQQVFDQTPYAIV